MSGPIDRRSFVETAGAATLLGLSEVGFLKTLRPVPASEAKLEPKLVQLRPEIEPLVRLLEETPRARLLEEVAARMRRGLSYREVLAALLLAGVRNVQPRPHVGYKFHAVLVVNSAHLASLAAPDSERWLPIFWALDYFKSAQASDLKEGDWSMPAVEESALPAAHKARAAFLAAMDAWDEKPADAAIASLARSAPANELFDLFCRYGARDFRSIGHKIIFVANSWRTLGCIGWQHAEPVLRSLAYALLNHHGEPNPAQSDLSADRPGRLNGELAETIRPDWRDGKADPAATAELLAVLRGGSDVDVAKKVVELLNRGLAPQSIWDGLFAGAAELLMRQPGIVSLHAVTSTNALHYCYQHCGDDPTRRLLLLQNAAFLSLFLQEMQGRGRVSHRALEQLDGKEAAEPSAGAVDEIFADVSRDRHRAAQKAFAYLQAKGDPEALMRAARLLIFFKGNDSHDYKFSSAVLEDCYHISPAWRVRYLATSLYLLRGSADRDNPLVQRTRAALAG